MIPMIEWGVLVGTVALSASFFTLTSKRSRRRVFIIISVISLLAVAYTTIRAATGLVYGFFNVAGLPVSLVLLGGLAFGAATMKYVFNRPELVKWVCVPGCWLFAVTIMSILIYTIFLLFKAPSQFMSIQYLLTFALPFTLVAGFVSSAISKFNIRVFQIFLPIVVVLFCLQLLNAYAVIASLYKEDFFKDPPPDLERLERFLVNKIGDVGHFVASWYRIVAPRMTGPGQPN